MKKFIKPLIEVIKIDNDEIIDEVIDGSYLELDEYINEHYR